MSTTIVTIIVALIGEEATVKRVFWEKGHVRLQPENLEFEPIIVDEVTVLGKVVSFFKVRRIYSLCIF